MLIVCPNCQTCYSVDRQRFEPSGRTVRCSNCGNSWRQGPVESPPPPYARAAQPQYQQSQQGYPPPPPGYMPYPPPGYAPYPPPGYPPYPAQAGAPAATPEPAAPAAPMEDDDDEVVEPNFDLPDPEEDDDLDDGIAANIDAMFGDDDDDDDFDVEEDIPDETGGGDDDLSDDEIDGLFDDDSEQTGISSMVDSRSGDDGADGIDNLDDIPEPDPLPESLTGSFDGDDDEDEDDDEVPVGRPRRKQAKAKKKGKGGLIALIVVLVLLVGTIAAGFFARALIVELVPQTKMVYDMIGIETGVLGDGLEIQDVKSSRATDAGTDLLIVSGTIRNVEAETKPVPLVQAVLLDGEGVEMQSVVQEPAMAELPAGGSVDFAIRIEEPSPLSRRLEVTFAPRPEAGGHDEGH